MGQRDIEMQLRSLEEVPVVGGGVGVGMEGGKGTAPLIVDKNNKCRKFISPPLSLFEQEKVHLHPDHTHSPKAGHH